MSEQEKIIQKLFNHAAIELAEGTSKELIIAGFVDSNIPREIAENIVAQANDYKKSEFRKRGMKTVAMGVGFLLLGGVITAITYSAASGGGTYVVTTGLFLVGALTIAKGLWRTLLG